MQEADVYDTIYCGLGISSILHFLENENLYKDKKVLFLEAQQEFDLNKTISGFSPSINLPTINKFHFFECHFGNQKKKYESKIPYNILDLNRIYSLFLEKSKNAQVHFKTSVIKINKEHFYQVITKGRDYYGINIYDSRPPVLPNNNYMKQHFLGWFIRFNKPHQIKCPIIMDIDQSSKNLCFNYTLPFSENELLVENTYYSMEVLDTKDYELNLTKYLAHKFPKNSYEIYKKERGVIPLVEFEQTKNYQNYKCLGIRNGHLRVSTGYSVFSSFEKKRPSQILNNLDQFLLKVLWMSPQLGGKIFTHFLKKIDGPTLADFMSVSPSFKSITKAALSMPIPIFIKAAMSMPFRGISFSARKQKKNILSKHYLQGPHG